MKKKAILIRVTETVYKVIKQIAAEEKWSLNQTGEEAMTFYLKARRKI